MGIGAAAITQLSQLPQSARMRQMEEDEQERQQHLRQQQTDFFNQEAQADANFATANAQIPDPTLDPNNPDILARAMQMGDALSTQQAQNQAATDAKANTPLTSAFDAVSAGVNAANNYATSQVPSIAIGAGLAAAAPVLSPAGTAMSAVSAGSDRVSRWNATSTQSSLMSQQGLVGNNSSVDTSEDNSFLELAHNGLGLGGIATGIGEFSNEMGDYWRGKNGLWYLTDSNFWGNQYTGSKIAVLGKAAIFSAAGKFLFGLDTIAQAPSIIVNAENDNYAALTKTGVDITVGAIGAWGGPVGWVIAGAYTAVDLTVGWPEAINTMENAMVIANQMNEETSEITGRSIWVGPKV